MKVNDSTSIAEKDNSIGGMYKLKKKLGSGSFGIVYQGFNKFTGEPVALKLEKIEEKNNLSVKFEAAIMKQLDSIEGIPKIHWSGKHDNYEIMVQQLLGKDLGSYMKLLKRFPLKKILNLASNGLRILEEVHKKGILHRDLKPENIAMGRGSDCNSVYLIDFGISKSFLDIHGDHIPFRDGKPFIGTCRYASLAAHEGLELGRKDDLESFGFVLLYLMQGSLPWQSVKAPDKERIKAVGEMKKQTTFEGLCRDLPIEFISYFKYVRSLKFQERPNYILLQEIFRKIADRENISVLSLDSVEWTQTSYLAIKKKKTPSKRSSCQNLKNGLSEKKMVSVPLTPQGIRNGFKVSFDTTEEIFQQPQVERNKSSLLNPLDLGKNKHGSLLNLENSISVSYSSMGNSQFRSICIRDRTDIIEEEYKQEVAEYIVPIRNEVLYLEDFPSFKMKIISNFLVQPKFPAF